MKNALSVALEVIARAAILIGRFRIREEAFIIITKNKISKRKLVIISVGNKASLRKYIRCSANCGSSRYRNISERAYGGCEATGNYNCYGKRNRGKCLSRRSRKLGHCFCYKHSLARGSPYNKNFSRDNSYHSMFSKRKRNKARRYRLCGGYAKWVRSWFGVYIYNIVPPHNLYLRKSYTQDISSYHPSRGRKHRSSRNKFCCCQCGDRGSKKTRGRFYSGPNNFSILRQFYKLLYSVWFHRR